MRVLWFVNKVPVRLAEQLGHTPDNKGAWIDAMQEMVAACDDVDLTVAVPHSVDFGTVVAGPVRFVRLPGESSSRLERVLSRWSGDVDSSCASAVREVVETVKPDLVHVHGTERVYGSVICDIGIPWVLTIQGLVTACEALDSRGWDQHAQSALRWTEYVRGADPRVYGRITRHRARRERYTLSRASVVAGRTEFDRQLAGLLGPQAMYAHVDEPLREPFLQARWRAQPEGPLVAMGGDYARKGLGDLVRALALLHNNGHTGLRLRICGAPQVGYSARALRRIVDHCELTRHVDLLPELDARALATELSEGLAYIHPTHVDNSPNSLCEAMCVGIPCIATRVGGIPSLANDSEAVLVDDEPFSLAAGINRVVVDPSFASSIGRNARERALERHAYHTVLSQLRHAYALALGDHASCDPEVMQ